MILQTLETEELIITSKLMAELSVPSLTELMLHRSSLYSAAVASHVPDIAYIESIQREIIAIHEELMGRSVEMI